MTGLEAVTVRTSLEASHAVTTQPVQIDAGNLGKLQSSWSWSQVGQHQVCSVASNPHLSLP